MAKVDKDKLKQELIYSLEIGEMTNGFAVIAREIIYQTIFKKSKGVPKAEQEEMIGLAFVKLMRNWEKIDPAKYPASYISRIAISAYGDEMRKYETKKKKLEKFEVINENNQQNINTSHLIEIDIRKLEAKYRRTLKKKAIKMLKMGLSYRAVARGLNTNDWTVRYWHKQYKERGHRSYLKDLRKNNNRWI